MGSTSFTNVLSPKCITGKVNFRPLVNENRIENHDTLLPKTAMESVGMKISFPIVQIYVTNTWGKFCLKKLMKNYVGVFFFKFDSKEVMDNVLQRGP